MAFDVSIIVPAFNNWAVTERCLASLVESSRSSTLRAEILLADDASTDETATEWVRFKDSPWPVRHMRNDVNLGFLGNCNAAAAAAEGTYLCLLNNDVVVEPGWLDQLVHTLEVEPNAGAVGPLFLKPGGQILECGAMIHSDASGRQLGWGAAATDSRFAYLNDVDYVSGACLCLRTELFHELGGFDDHFAPAYYEDVDLCFRLAEKGVRILVNPAARMTHHEGSTHGTSGGLKRFQEINRRKFKLRWADRLASMHPSPELPVDRIRTWRRSGTIAFYYPRPLTFNMDAGALRLYRLMLELRRRNYHVVIVNLDDDDQRRRTFHEAGIQTMFASWGGDDGHVEWLENDPPVAAVFSHVPSEERFSKSYYALSPSTVRIFDTVDLHLLRTARRAAVANGLTRAPDPTLEDLDADGLDELAAARRSDMTLVVSGYERDLLIGSFAWEPRRLRVVSTIHEPEAEFRPMDDRAGFVFLAGFAHPPNVDAAEWIVGKIWPLIKRELPDAWLDIYGSAMPDRVQALAAENGVFTRGFVHDHRAALASARVMLAPLRYGAGVKGKIGEALAAGTPVVTNRVGIEGMDDAGSAVSVGETPEEIAEVAVRLYRDAEEWQRRSDAGRSVLSERFSTVANTDALLATIADGRAWRSKPSAYDVELRLLWHELGHPGRPFTHAMVRDNLRTSKVGALPSLPNRLWRYYSDHGFRALSRRVGDEVGLRRQASRSVPSPERTRSFVPSIPSHVEYYQMLQSWRAWAPAVTEACRRAGIQVDRGLDDSSKSLGSSFPAFVVDERYMVKLFGPWNLGQRAFAREAAAYELLSGAQTELAVPRRIGQGELGNGWYYLIIELLPGIAFEEIPDDIADNSRPATTSWMGDFAGRLHGVPVPAELTERAVTEFGDVLAWQYERQLPHRLADGQVLGELTGQVRDWLRPPAEMLTTANEFVLVHGDLHHGNVIGEVIEGKFAPRGVVDFGEASVAHPLWELGEVFRAVHGERALLDRFMASWQWPGRAQPNFPSLALSYVLYRDVDAFERCAELERATSLEDLADRLFG